VVSPLDEVEISQKNWMDHFPSSFLSCQKNLVGFHFRFGQANQHIPTIPKLDTIINIPDISQADLYHLDILPI
jgi:hypothetical protein